MLVLKLHYRIITCTIFAFDLFLNCAHVFSHVITIFFFLSWKALTIYIKRHQSFATVTRNGFPAKNTRLLEPIFTGPACYPPFSPDPIRFILGCSRDFHTHHTSSKNTAMVLCYGISQKFPAASFFFYNSSKPQPEIFSKIETH